MARMLCGLTCVGLAKYFIVYYLLFIIIFILFPSHGKEYDDEMLGKKNTREVTAKANNPDFLPYQPRTD